jgi:hypothetical protein
VWARLHKVDRIKPLAGGGAIAIVDDERSNAQISRVPSLSTLVAVARILNAKRALDAKFGGTGEVRYVVASPPPFLSDAIQRAGAAVADHKGERVVLPPQPGAIASTIDLAFADLAHHVRGQYSAQTIADALKRVETDRRRQPLARDADPDKYWCAVLELAALAGEATRPRGTRWVDTTEVPVPFAILYPTGERATPTRYAQQVVEGQQADPPPAT